MILYLFRRILKLIKRYISAKKFGLKFVRAAKWELPNNIIYKDKLYKIYADGSKDSGAKDAFLDIFIDDEYNLKKVSKRYSIKSIIDVGGHSGFFSLYAKLLFPEAIIHCYEPNSDLHNYIIYHSKQVDFMLFPEAVGSNDGYVILEKYDKTILTKTLISEKGDIVLTSLSNIIRRFDGEIDLLKLDCEGAEWDIFNDKKSFANIKMLTMEFHLSGDKDINFLKATICSLNFEIKSFKLTGPSWGMLYAINKFYFSR